MPQENKGISHTKGRPDLSVDAEDQAIPCKEGHLAGRTKRGECKECRRLRRRYKSRMPTPPEKQTSPCRNGHMDGLDKWGRCPTCRSNSMRHKASQHQQYVLRRYPEARDRSSITLDEMEAYMIERTNKPCTYCGSPATHIDHMTPLSRGGDHEFDNIQMICRSCNFAKGDKDCDEFDSWIQKLIEYQELT